MRRLISQSAWSRALTACGTAAFVFGAALVAAGTGQPARAWANAPISITPDTVGVTAADFATRDCSPLFGGGPLAGQDIWVFDLPGDHMVTGDFTSVEAEFTVPDGGEATASIPDEGGSIVLDETSRAWISLPAGWTLTGAKAEVSGSAESFTLAQTCPADPAAAPAPDPSGSPAPDPSGAPITDPSAPPAEPDPSGSPVPGAFVSPEPPVDPSAAPEPSADPFAPIVAPDPSSAPEPPADPIVPPVAPDPSAAPEPPVDPFMPPVAPDPSADPIAPSAAPEPPVEPSAEPVPSEEPPSRPVHPQPVEPPANPGPDAPRPAAGWEGAASLGALWDDIMDAFPW